MGKWLKWLFNGLLMAIYGIYGLAWLKLMAEMAFYHRRQRNLG